jgi:hypothetical protein
LSRILIFRSSPEDRSNNGPDDPEVLRASRSLDRVPALRELQLRRFAAFNGERDDHRRIRRRAEPEVPDMEERELPLTRAFGLANQPAIFDSDVDREHAALQAIQVIDTGKLVAVGIG